MPDLAARERGVLAAAFGGAASSLVISAAESIAETSVDFAVLAEALAPVALALRGAAAREVPRLEAPALSAGLPEALAGSLGASAEAEAGASVALPEISLEASADFLLLAAGAFAVLPALRPAALAVAAALDAGVGEESACAALEEGATLESRVLPESGASWVGVDSDALDAALPVAALAEAGFPEAGLAAVLALLSGLAAVWLSALRAGLASLLFLPAVGFSAALALAAVFLELSFLELSFFAFGVSALSFLDLVVF